MKMALTTPNLTMPVNGGQCSKSLNALLYERKSNEINEI